MDLKDLGKKLKDGINSGQITPSVEKIVTPDSEITKPPPEKYYADSTTVQEEKIKELPQEITVEITPDNIFNDVDGDVVLNIKFTKQQCLEIGTFLIKHS